MIEIQRSKDGIVWYNQEQANTTALFWDELRFERWLDTDLRTVEVKDRFEDFGMPDGLL